MENFAYKPFTPILVCLQVLLYAKPTTRNITNNFHFWTCCSFLAYKIIDFKLIIHKIK